MADSLSAVTQNELSNNEARRSGWDPQLRVPVVEMLGYNETGGVAQLNRVGVSANGYLLVSGSTGGGTLSLSNDASNNRVSAFSNDAGNLRVSSIGGSFSSSPLSADSSNISAVQGDASKLRTSALIDSGSVSAKQGSFPWSISGTVSAFINQGTVSAYSPDASLFRVSALGVTVNSSPLSADSSNVSAKQGTYPWSVSGNISAFLNEGSVSAKSPDAGSLRVSAFMDDAAKAHVSAYQGGTWSLTALLTDSTAHIGQVSGLNPDANLFHVSSVQGDAGLLHTSALQGSYPWSVSGNVSAFINQGTVSAYSPDAALFRVSAVNFPLNVSGTVSAFINQGTVSAIQPDANIFHTSAVQGDAGLQHVSAGLFPDTTGELTIFSNYNLSSSINVKATAGSIYGWYAWNTTTIPVYINFYNVTGAINVGTDSFKMQLMLPASAAANVPVFPMGLAGFTNGISLAAVSGAVSTSIGVVGTSAVGINLWYK